MRLVLALSLMPACTGEVIDSAYPTGGDPGPGDSAGGDPAPGDTGPDTSAPTVVSRSPVPSSVSVDPATTVEVTFSEPIDCSTVTATTFELIGVAATLGCSGATATLTPSGALAELSTYTAAVYSDVADAAGNTLASDALWTFTTGDTTPPAPPTFDNPAPPASPTQAASVAVGGDKEAGANVERRWTVDASLHQDWTEVVAIDATTGWSFPFPLELGDNLIELRSRDGVDLLSTVVSFSITREPSTSTVNPPVVDAAVTPTTVGNQVLSGTKDADTSIWIDGLLAVARDPSTSWSVLVTLAAGHQTYRITARDNGGGESVEVPVPIQYNPPGPVTGGGVQIDFELADLYSAIPAEFGNDPAAANHYSIEVWVEGPITYTGTGPYTFEACRFDATTHQRKHPRYIAGVSRGGGVGCLGANPPHRCWWFGEPDFFAPNFLAAILEAPPQWWTTATNPAGASTDRRNASGGTYMPQENPTSGGCNRHLYYHDQWCRFRAQQGPDIDGTTEASKRPGTVSYTWDLRDSNGDLVQRGPYLVNVLITLDRAEAQARLTDRETCWDNPSHDNQGAHRLDGVVFVDGATAYSGTWTEKGADTGVSYLLGDATVTYTP